MILCAPCKDDCSAITQGKRCARVDVTSFLAVDALKSVHDRITCLIRNPAFGAAPIASVPCGMRSIRFLRAAALRCPGLLAAAAAAPALPRPFTFFAQSQPHHATGRIQRRHHRHPQSAQELTCLFQNPHS